MPYKARIRQLEEMHRALDKNIIEYAEKHPSDQFKLEEMKKIKLQYRDEISRLNRLQWEEDHERVNFDDDR